MPLRVASAGVPTHQGGRDHHRVHARARFCCPRAVALAPTVCTHHQVPTWCPWCPEHHVAARLQISSPKPGRRARGEGTNKVSVRQGGGMPAHFQPLCAPTAFNPPCGAMLQRNHASEPWKSLGIYMENSMVPLRHNHLIELIKAI